METTVVQDDIFSRPPRSAARQPSNVAHITCRVCDKPATVPIDHPALLCPLCLEDLDKTVAHIAEVYAAAIVAFQREMETFDAMVRGDAWWTKVQAARHGQHARFAQAWAQAKQDKHRAVCLAWEELEAMAEIVIDRAVWFAAAKREIAAARAAKEHSDDN